MIYILVKRTMGEDALDVHGATSNEAVAKAWECGDYCNQVVEIDDIGYVSQLAIKSRTK